MKKNIALIVLMLLGLFTYAQNKLYTTKDGKQDKVAGSLIGTKIFEHFFTTNTDSLVGMIARDTVYKTNKGVKTKPIYIIAKDSIYPFNAYKKTYGVAGYLKGNEVYYPMGKENTPTLVGFIDGGGIQAAAALLLVLHW